MIDSTKFLVISDSNWRQYAAVAPGGCYPHEELRQILRGSTGYKGWQNPDAPHVFKGEMQVDTVIPRSEWAGMIAAGAGMKAFNALNAAGVKAKDQNGLDYCWVYGSTRVVEARRLVEGLPHVELAPESVGGPCTGWRNEGGYASEAFTQIQKGGICEESFLDKPCSLKVRNWKTGWQDNALKHASVDWYNIDGSSSAGPMFDQVMSQLLQENPVAAGLSWWGHLIAFLAPVLFPNGSFGVLFQNSWTPDWPTTGANGYAILTESRATPDGAASCTLTVDAPVNPDPGPPPQPDPSL
jgi:hypothetical protein